MNPGAKPPEWQDIGQAQAVSGRIYEPLPVPEGCTELTVYIVNCTITTSGPGGDGFSMIPLSEFCGTYRQALAELDALRDDQPHAAAVAAIHEVRLLFRHDDPAQMAELALYRKLLAKEAEVLQ